jgi:hypothetical protein
MKLTLDQARRQAMGRFARSLRVMLGTMIPAIAIVLVMGTPSFAARHRDRDRDTCKVERTDAEDIQYLADWVAGLQYDNPKLTSFGAITIHHTPGFVDAKGFAYFDVVPYTVNLAVVGLLETDVPGKLTLAQNWIRWYLTHLNKDGSISNTWYRADGSGEATCLVKGDHFLCDYADAADTTAATFLGMVWAYHEAGGDSKFLKEYRSSIEKVAGLVLSLQQKDGLTWASNGIRTKLLMNNSEVYWGLRAMADLEHSLFDKKQASRYDGAARRVRHGINESLWNKKARLYRIAEFEDGGLMDADLDQWYVGTVTIVWPQLFDVTGDRSSRAKRQMEALNKSWDGSPNTNWTAAFADPSGFAWTSVGYAALLSGDCGRARAHANLVKAKKFPNLDWPWTVEDAGWLLRTLSGFDKR